VSVTSRVATFANLERAAKSTFVPPERRQTRRSRLSSQRYPPPGTLSLFWSRLGNLSSCKPYALTNAIRCAVAVAVIPPYFYFCSMHPSLAAHEFIAYSRLCDSSSGRLCRQHGLFYCFRHPSDLSLCDLEPWSLTCRRIVSSPSVRRRANPPIRYP